MTRRPMTITAAMLLGLATLAAPPLSAQGRRAWGRVSFLANTSTTTPDAGESSSFGEFATTVTFHSAEDDTDSFEYGLDTRLAGYAAEGRDPRVSVYDAWVGRRMMDGRLIVRGGHMWVNEVGGLGSIAGGLVEWRRKVPAGTLRVAGFAGLEPRVFAGGYVPDVWRAGGHVTLEGRAGRRHTAGYVTIRNSGFTERSVLTTTNYLPVAGKVFVYQAAEIDLAGPAGQGSGGLTYFFINGRATVAPRVDLQGTYHRGRSIDTRTITVDQANGRPVSVQALDGLLYESVTSRVTVEAARGVRVFGGLGRDRTDRDADATRRYNAGFHVSGRALAGADLTVSYSRMDRGRPGSYGSWYVSAGRSVSARIYLSGDFSSSLAITRFTRSDGVVIETRPETKRFSVTALANLTRSLSLLVTAEHTRDTGAHENRLLAGLTWRVP